MADRKPRATKEEALIAKIAKNEESKEKLQAKINELDAKIDGLKQQLKDLNDEKKKAERATEARAKREEKKKAEKEIIKAISASGLSMEEVMERLKAE